MPRAGFEPGSSSEYQLDFDSFFKPLSHHGRFIYTTVVFKTIISRILKILNSKVLLCKYVLAICI